MAGRQKNDTTIQFLIYSFIGLLIFSIVIFSILGIYMSQKSRKAVYKVGEIYMSGMNEQMSRHFETVIKLRFDQVSGIVSVVSTDNNDKEALYEELIYRAQVRDFDYLALCSAEGNFETLYGHPIQPLNPEPFVEALLQSEQRVAVGVDSDEKEVVLFGVDAAYPMQNGDMSTGLIAAVPLEYITDFLSLEDKGQLMYYHIIRPDGSFVIQNPNTELWPFFEELQKHLALAENDSSEENSIDEFGIALKDHKKYAATFEVNGEERQIYGIPLPYSEWYLVAVMPYGILDDTINSLSSQRMVMTLLSCASVLFILTLIFLRYYSMTRSQLHELEKARQTALESSKAKSEFLANMSHDIRTPMNAIVGMTAIATAHMDDREQVQSCLRKITLSSKHLLGLINDVLDMSKIESGKINISLEQISLPDMIGAVMDMCLPLINGKHQQFQMSIGHINHEHVIADGDRLRQVLMNLISNAVKYTPEGGTITLRINEQYSPNPKKSQYEFICIDTGIGISEEFLPHIFEPFSRAEDSRISKIQGTGLGMAITENIVRMMNGTIGVESKIGTGSKFTVSVPLEICGEEEVCTEELSGRPVLVVDDDRMTCESAAALLVELGMRGEWVLSGKEAVSRVVEAHNAAEDFFAVILDWKMPEMDGLEATKAIRENLGGHVPIIVISAYDYSEIEEQFLEAGADAFITKPLFKSKILQVLQLFVSVDKEDDTGDNEEEKQTGIEGKRVLLVEDNDINREIVIELLEMNHVHVDSAGNGQLGKEAFEASAPGDYSAILMDIQMPVMDGYQASEAIRALTREDARTVPILALTANAFATDIGKAHCAGMNDHVAKPIEVERFMETLRRWIR